MVEAWVYLVKNDLDISANPTDTFISFENLLIKIPSNNESVHFLNINKPPSTRFELFWNNYSHFWKNIYLTTDNLLINSSCH